MAIVKTTTFHPNCSATGRIRRQPSATRENVDRTNAARADQAQLNQQGAIASAQLAQHAQDRNVNAAIKPIKIRMRLQANADDNHYGS